MPSSGTHFSFLPRSFYFSMISSKRFHYRFKLQPRNHVGWEITRPPPLHHLPLSVTFRPTRRCIFYYESNTILQIKFQPRTEMKFFYFLPPLSSHVSRGYRDSPLSSPFFLSSFIKESRPFSQETRIILQSKIFHPSMNLNKRFFLRSEENLRRFRNNWTIKEMDIIKLIDRACFQIVSKSANVYIFSPSSVYTPIAWSTLRSIHGEHC